MIRKIVDVVVKTNEDAMIVVATEMTAIFVYHIRLICLISVEKNLAIETETSVMIVVWIVMIVTIGMIATESIEISVAIATLEAAGEMIEEIRQRNLFVLRR